MNTISKLVIITLVSIILLVGCTPDSAHQYTVQEEATYIAVCSDTASIDEIETYTAGIYGESIGLIWQLDSQCVTYAK